MTIIRFYVETKLFFYRMNDSLKNILSILLSLGGVMLFVLFFHGMNKSLEKNFKSGLFMIIISFLCGIILMATSLHFFATEHPASKPPVEKKIKVVKD